jgi:hypothetical protein
LSELLLYLVAFALNTLAPIVLVRRDVARLHGEQLARSWPDSSLWSAALMFGPLCIPIHYLRTRRSLLGVLLATFWLGYTLLLLVFLLTDLETLLGVEEGVPGPPAATSGARAPR